MIYKQNLSFFYMKLEMTPMQDIPQGGDERLWQNWIYVVLTCIVALFFILVFLRYYAVI